VKKDGSTLDIHLSASVITNESGEPVSIMVSFVDITERKRIEKKVNNLNFAPNTAHNFNQLITGNLPIQKVGINFGAPGDRKADNGTLWLEYPPVGGPSPNIPVNIAPDKFLFSIDLNFQTDLDNKIISDELQHQFENQGILLYKGATISIEKKDVEWLITGNDRKRYIIRKEKGKNIYHGDYEKLNVYRENYERFCHHSSQIQGEGLKWVAASGLKGVSSITINLSGNRTNTTAQDRDMKSIPKRPYTVRLYFAEPDEIKPEQRVFDIAIQGRKVLKNFDIVKEAGMPNYSVVKELNEILVRDDLTVDFTPSDNAMVGSPLICGIEIIAEGW
jgi:hypothetical protein